MTAAQVLTTQDNIDLAINAIKRFNRLYNQTDSLGEKDAYIDRIHSAKMELVHVYGFTWSEVEAIV